MTYCKFCGMESKKPDKCEWCGRVLAQTQPPPPVKPPDFVPTTADKVEQMDEEDRKSRARFYVSSIALLILAAILVAIHKQLYPFVITGGLFVSGILLGRFRIIPPFDNEWSEMGIPLLLVLLLPSFIVCAGYIAYGLIYRSMDLTVVWLIGTYIAMLTALEIIVTAVMIGGVPAGFLLWIRVIEFASLAGIILGWMVSGSFRTDR